MSDENAKPFPWWWSVALKRSVPDLASLWVTGEFPDLVEEGYVDPCVDCGQHIGIPPLAGRCIACDRKELESGMPPRDRLALDLDMRTALGYTGAESLPYTEYISRDASYWDSRTFRGWTNFRIQLLAVSGATLPSLPMRWTLAPEALPRGAQASRLILEPAAVRADPITWDAETMARLNERIAIMRVRLWRPGEPGYLQGLWDGQNQRIRWDLCDLGDVDDRDLPLWLAAFAERRNVKPGPKLSQRQSRTEFVADARAAVAAIRADNRRLGTALPLFQPDIAARMGMSDRTLRTRLSNHHLTFDELIAEVKTSLDAP